MTLSTNGLSQPDLTPKSPRTRICVTPTRNEAWIVERFARAARLWADHLIVADQMSTDTTRDLLSDRPGVTVVKNHSPVYDEAYRQRLLLEHARKISSRAVLLGLDADESLSANAVESDEWELINQAAPGTVLRFRWVNILPGFQQAWIPHDRIVCGFIDDGSPHAGRRIHSPRVPQPHGAPVLDLNEIVVLHFQYVSWERMSSKQRWYQAWEHVKHQKKGPLEIFRMYNHMLGGWEPTEIHPVQPEWFARFEQQGIDFRSLECEPVTWWDREIVQMLIEHGPAHFRRTAIWGKNWNLFAQQIGTTGRDLSDPRSSWEKLVHRMLKATQQRRANWAVRVLERLLRLTGW